MTEYQFLKRQWVNEAFTEFGGAVEHGDIAKAVGALETHLRVSDLSRRELRRHKREAFRAVSDEFGINPVLAWLGWTALSYMIRWVVERWFQNLSKSSEFAAEFGLQD